MVPTTVRLESPRLEYRRLTESELDEFHALAVDAHIRSYMFDGVEVERGWADEALAASDALFEAEGVGLWLVTAGEEVIGFVGYHVFTQPDEEPQLLYAFTKPHTGRGYATEATRALLVAAASLGWKRAVSAVDEPNKASVRVLEKTGFRRLFSFPGAFGQQHYFSRSFEEDGG